jgi:hypothetical protein
LQEFDQPVLETNCTRRATSTVSTQALTLLNSDFLAKQAAAFAGRILKEYSDAPAGYAVQLAFSRLATVKEQERLNAFLDAQASRYTTQDKEGAKRQALTDLCHILFSTNEFVYVD